MRNAASDPGSIPGASIALLFGDGEGAAVDLDRGHLGFGCLALPLGLIISYSYRDG